MRITLFRLLAISFLHAYALVGYGQGAAPSQAPGKIPEPLYILNSNIIATGGIPGLDANKIRSMAVYKSNNDQSIPALLKGLAPMGIIAVTYAGKVRSKSFATVGRQHRTQAPFGVVINGQRLDATQQKTLRIAPEAVGQVRITPATATSEALVNIQLTESKPSTTPRPPGTIMIR